MSQDKALASEVASAIVRKSAEQKEQKEQSITEKKEALKEITSKLDRLERTTGPSGAIPNAPKQFLLDASDVEAKHPEKRLRWVNLDNNDKLASRQAQGYERLSVADGGKQVGNLALFGLSRRVFDQRVAGIERMNEARLNAHKAEVEKVADAVARELRDRHGIKIDAERIMFEER